MNSNARKTAFLGMPGGTAQARLKKAILFKYVQMAGDDICFRCHNKIASIDELSIEHKQPWLYISVDLFWDMDNIAFSHLKCNLPHRYNTGPVAWKVRDDGKVWCPDCQDYLDRTLFRSHKGQPNDLSLYCKPHDYSRKQKAPSRRKKLNADYRLRGRI